MKKIIALSLIWLVTSAIAIAFAVLPIDSITVDGSYVVANNDAFYHARRILDAAIGERGFYQFDKMMHVPEGSWIAWPWGYDLAVAYALKLALWLQPSADPMRFLAYVSVAWLPVNVALLLAIASVVKLRLELRALVTLGFALLPLTQSLHRVGALDHHYIELTFVLLTCWLALRLFTTPANRWAAVWCGVSLGLAHAFHHGLFILQLPVLACVGVLWLRGIATSKPSLLVLAASLAATTLLVALPSGPLQDGQFSMGTFSWFHVYIAFCTAALMSVMALRKYSMKSLALLAGLGLLLTIPVVAEIARGTQFLTGQLLMLDRIVEMTSPLRMMIGNWGPAYTLGMYSGLLLLAPILIGVFAFRTFTQSSGLHVGFAIFALFGLTLLLFQFRLNYFGLPFLLIGPAYLIDQSRWLGARNKFHVALASIIVFILIFQPPLRGPLFNKYPLGGDHLYAQVYSLWKPLQQKCAAKPGIVAAASQFGHYIRFHSDCSVIANNFLLSPLDLAKVDEGNDLFYLSPAELRASRPDVRYVLAFLADAFEMQNGRVRFKSLDDIAQRNPPLILGLFFAATPPEGFDVIGEVTVETNSGEQVVLARLYETTPAGAAP